MKRSNLITVVVLTAAFGLAGCDLGIANDPEARAILATTQEASGCVSLASETTQEIEIPVEFVDAGYEIPVEFVDAEIEIPVVFTEAEIEIPVVFTEAEIEIPVEFVDAAL